MYRRSTLSILFVLLWWLHGMSAEVDANEPSPDAGKPRRNLATKTAGGTQFWSDVHVAGGWRIQRNALTQHCRLLDSKQVRRGWGSESECLSLLGKFKADLALPPPKQHAVLLLHGLGRSQKAMRGMATFLQAELPDASVINLSYASGRLPFADHAANLDSILAGLHADGVTQVSFVAHSMGNLVVRHFLADRGRDAASKRKLPRFERMVMLSPPNQGSRMAELLKSNPLFKLLTGKSGQTIASLADGESGFATPDFEFAIITGGRGKSTGRNPLLTGDDDLVVSVDEAKLEGARDFLVVPAIHTLIMNDRQVQQATRDFIKFGHLLSDDNRNPL